MPLLTVSISKDAGVDYSALVLEMTRISSTITGKLESQIMTTLTHEDIFMGGKPQPSAFIEYKFIGKLSDAVKSNICEKLSLLLYNDAKIPLENIYLNFTSVERSNWGVSKGILK